ncbi:hypothetical protein [Cronobacter phage EspYZU05]|uniref:Uncharacterized protein n=1 Tax=Cronobacter phage EspYZU05 TaxID=2836139 RepID=A0AA47NDP4_9CAUD|nr:hypothetical protein [Cronobacter phage EspYZU05]
MSLLSSILFIGITLFVVLVMIPWALRLDAEASIHELRKQMDKDYERD